jgi:homogentisate 1,2-dioxygenase
MTILNYLNGFGNHFQTEAIKDALPKTQNSPQKVPLGLYAEQLSGSAFAAPRHVNLHSWLYRILPSPKHGEFKLLKHATLCSAPFNSAPLPPTQLRWNPPPYPQKPTDFVQGLITVAGNGDPATHNGAAIYLYAINQSMQDAFFYNADGELLIVPQIGNLKFKTELGILEIKPGETIVIPRGIKFQVELLDKQACGYMLENFGQPFRLPELGVIGANGLANPRDFEYPVAAYEQKSAKFKLLTKFQGHLWQATIDHSPLDVVAWHGNYAPYKYDLRRFNTINTVSFDHTDPSIFTVLTSPSQLPGVANVDFVIFPERWLVAEDTFRPPYFHRNIMSEYMGLIYGAYDAKEEGFVPGGGSLHNCMAAHGPDADAYKKAVNAQLKPQYYHGTLAFMFESCNVWRPTKLALEAKFRQKDYLDCWKNLTANFKK